ncbi:MAG: GGDEF domain-containing protein [Caldimonas sp.]
MHDHLPTLLFALAGVLFIASAAATSLSFRQRSRRGASWWLAANGMLVAAIVVEGLVDSFSTAVPLAALLAVQWPVMTLAGLRHFFARGGSAVPPWADWAALTLAAVAIIGTWVAPLDLATPEQVLALATLALTVYAAVAIHRLDDVTSTVALKTLVAALATSAVAQAAWLAAALGGLAEVEAAHVALGALGATTALALLMTQLALVMHHERNVAHLRASHRKLRHLVDVDPLTRLPNRRHFHELAERAIKPAPTAATVLVFDVERLAHINEVLGHATGDEALRQIGNVLRETLRRRDVAGRLGGDEFAVVLPRTRREDAAAAIDRINARLDDRQVAPRIARIRLQVGSAQVQEGEGIADALRRAELALAASRREPPVSEGERTQPLPRPAPAVRTPEPEPARISAFGDIPVGEVTLASVPG